VVANLGLDLCSGLELMDLYKHTDRLAWAWNYKIPTYSNGHHLSPTIILLWKACYILDYPLSLCARSLWIIANIALAAACIPAAGIAAVGDVGVLCFGERVEKDDSCHMECVDSHDIKELQQSLTSVDWGRCPSQFSEDDHKKLVDNLLKQDTYISFQDPPPPCQHPKDSDYELLLKTIRTYPKQSSI